MERIFQFIGDQYHDHLPSKESLVWRKKEHLLTYDVTDGMLITLGKNTYNRNEVIQYYDHLEAHYALYAELSDHTSLYHFLQEPTAHFSIKSYDFSRLRKGDEFAQFFARPFNTAIVERARYIFDTYEDNADNRAEIKNFQEVYDGFSATYVHDSYFRIKDYFQQHFTEEVAYWETQTIKQIKTQGAKFQEGFSYPKHYLATLLYRKDFFLSEYATMIEELHLRIFEKCKYKVSQIPSSISLIMLYQSLYLQQENYQVEREEIIESLRSRSLYADIAEKNNYSKSIKLGALVLILALYFVMFYFANKQVSQKSDAKIEWFSN